MLLLLLCSVVDLFIDNDNDKMIKSAIVWQALGTTSMKMEMVLAKIPKYLIVKQTVIYYLTISLLSFIQEFITCALTQKIDKE